MGGNTKYFWLIFLFSEESFDSQDVFQRLVDERQLVTRDAEIGQLIEQRLAF